MNSLLQTECASDSSARRDGESDRAPPARLEVEIRSVNH
jgi:hypothetical protein